MTSAFRDTFVRSPDGLSLHVRTIGSVNGSGLPLLCLPGLTRTAEDFDVLAQAIANQSDASREVISVDYRGRGLSDYDQNPANYTIPIEANDIATIAASAGIERAVILGTSRGGLIGMLLAATQPSFVAGLALNDIGPELDIDGLMKIKGYISKLPPRLTWDDAEKGLQYLFKDAFPKLTRDDCSAWARRAFREENGTLVRTYDPELARSFMDISPDNAPPPLWDLFDVIADIPLLAIRGELSDLLSEPCVAEMQRRRPRMTILRVPDQGHAPLLEDAASIETIAAFCEQCDKAS